MEPLNVRQENSTAGLISEEYRELNKRLHRTKAHYGTTGEQLQKLVRTAARKHGVKSILDYGCGKGTLAPYLMAFDVREYDPAIEGKEALPEPADMVVCTEVLEHVEPECLTGVLDHLQSLATKLVFLTAATGAALKTLPDGRNAHLIQESMVWWLERLESRWDRLEIEKVNDGFLFIGKPKQSTATEAA